MKADQAETLALKALGWLAGNDELFPVFLGASGASTGDVAARASDPEFLIAVLDFIAMDDAWVIAFCDQHSLPYDTPVRARHALPGGAEMNWT
ncbi:hypothetical protein ATO10_11442 [Actibacterium atlanticum]|uniref:DUF3572 domain-containing protein n=1 Tax=Actibacterium atlanticum TaxID=1461693 RepID=A0A058ZIW7_9RHOB|nr:DUF3572 domain-containing protein [Actibacterium atlanticum]KCV81523.1 hypothetical protein ATO10_11442 [Actibacterium atlanticum]